VGFNYYGSIGASYSTGTVSGNENIGGLVGVGDANEVVASFWDTKSSGQATSDGGIGKTTAEMQDIQTYLGAGWDFVGEAGNGLHEIWRMPEGGSYPVLAIISGYIPPQLLGLGTPDDPYLISDALELGTMIHYSRYAHYRLNAPIDLSSIRWGMAVIPVFAGTFDGGGHTISHLTITGGNHVGFFGLLESGAEVRDLGVVDVNITGSAGNIGGLVGQMVATCYVTRCYSTGAVSGERYVGGLVGVNDEGTVIDCYSTGAVSGERYVGGLAGENRGSLIRCYSTGMVSSTAQYSSVGGLVGENNGTVIQCYSASTVSGSGSHWVYRGVGGLVGGNGGTVTNCYSTGEVRGDWVVGGLVGGNRGTVTNCYSTSAVTGTGLNIGGLVGGNWSDSVNACFWDTQTSGQAETPWSGSRGRTTAEMQTASTFLDAGWDFVGEAANGTEDLWWILEGKDYPRLWWEAK